MTVQYKFPERSRVEDFPHKTQQKTHFSLIFRLQKVAITRPMTQHSSFSRGNKSTKKKRNVLKRFERVEILRQSGRYQEGDSVIGLPKTLPPV